MGRGRHLPRHRIGRIDGEVLRALHRGRERMAVGEHEARHAIGQRRLADALRAADQPGMRNAPRSIGVQERRLGLAMPEQIGGLARMSCRGLLLDFSRTHAGPAAASR